MALNPINPPHLPPTAAAADAEGHRAAATRSPLQAVLSVLPPLLLLLLAQGTPPAAPSANLGSSPSAQTDTPAQSSTLRRAGGRRSASRAA